MLHQASTIHGIFNLPRMHWAYFVILKHRKCLIICETGNYISHAFGTSLLRVLSHVLDKPDMAHWDVIRLGPTAGVPAQLDGKSCGVYSCILLESVFKGRAFLQFTHNSLQEWRAHIAHAILSRTPSYAPRYPAHYVA